MFLTYFYIHVIVQSAQKLKTMLRTSRSDRATGTLTTTFITFTLSGRIRSYQG